jgi:hypothetical protein
VTVGGWVGGRVGGMGGEKESASEDTQAIVRLNLLQIKVILSQLNTNADHIFSIVVEIVFVSSFLTRFKKQQNSMKLFA